MDTSAVARVLNTRSITGCWSESVPWMDSASPHDSSGWSSGRMRSQSTVVSIRVAQAHLERNAAECLGNTQRLGKRVHRVHGANIASGTPPLARADRVAQVVGCTGTVESGDRLGGLDVYTHVAERLIHRVDSERTSIALGVVAPARTGSASSRSSSPRGVAIRLADAARRRRVGDGSAPSKRTTMRAHCPAHVIHSSAFRPVSERRGPM